MSKKNLAKLSGSLTANQLQNKLNQLKLPRKVKRELLAQKRTGVVYE